MNDMPMIRLRPIGGHEAAEAPAQPACDQPAPQPTGWLPALAGRGKRAIGSRSQRMRSAAQARRARVQAARQARRDAQRAGEGDDEQEERPPFIATLKGQTAICAGVLLLALALKAVDAEPARTVAATLDEALGAQTTVEESTGRLRYVQELFDGAVSVFSAGEDGPVLQTPFDGKLTRRYGLLYPGVGITGSRAEVYACQKGKVTSVTANDDGTVTVTIEHKKGLETVYSIASAVVEEGKRVGAGDQIGLAAGQDGKYSMFLQVRQDGTVVDPLGYLQ